MKIFAVDTNRTTENEAIRRIVIYGNGEKHYTTNNGYFEEVRTNESGEMRTVYDGRISSITLSSEPKRARKENLNRKDNYLLSYSGRYSWESGLALYIHCSEITATAQGEAIASQISGETNYKNIVKLSFKHTIVFNRHHIEEEKNAGEHFTPPDGCRWSESYSNDPEHPNYGIARNSYFTGDDDETIRVLKRWIEKTPAFDMLVSSDGYTRTEKDNNRQQREKIADYINKHKIFYKDVSHYEIERLLQHFDIKLKTEGANND